MHYRQLILVGWLFLWFSCGKSDTPEPVPEKLGVTYVYIGTKALTTTGTNTDIDLESPVEIRFTKAVNQTSAEQNIALYDAANQKLAVTFSWFDQNQLVKLSHPAFAEGASFKINISNALLAEDGGAFDGQNYAFTTLIPPLILESVLVNGVVVNPLLRIRDIARDAKLEFHFNSEISKNDLADYSAFRLGSSVVSYTMAQVDAKTISMNADQLLEGFRKYRFTISSSIENRIGKPFAGLDLGFYTEFDPTPKFPEISDDELLTKVQQQTFKYFWDFGHPISGMARERNSSNETVTSGGSGFGIMSIIVGIERGFVTREQGVDRLQTIVDFLGKADRFHGAWSHWMNGTTGKALPFSTKDDGGDLVETSFMAAGLLAVRQYLNPANPNENTLINKINSLWRDIEWDWYTRSGQNVLYWHWSPTYNWDMNMKIQGYNEALITYIMAASSPTHSISADVYHQGWAKSGAIANGKQYYGITLPLGYEYGGPLFFTHYSFLGIDPRNLSDQYANYWQQNRNHTLINFAYCVDNPKNYVSYSDNCWGLTASDNHQGYSAHSPTNDLGVITPTAAISSIAYTPEESMAAIRFFYYILGDRLWGEYGFYDAFNVTEEWTAGSFLAIDQGPIVVMIENYRTALIWKLLMSAPEVKSGLTKLGFSY